MFETVPAPNTRDLAPHCFLISNSRSAMVSSALSHETLSKRLSPFFPTRTRGLVIRSGWHRTSLHARPLGQIDPWLKGCALFGENMPQAPFG